MSEPSLFYLEKPVFGFDLGFNSIKLMQIDTSQKQHMVSGYGYGSFDNKAVRNGVIVDPEAIAKVVYKIITKDIVGTIDSRRIAASLPASRTFSRVLTLPAMAKSDMDEAVRLEAEQYIPVPADELYIDYEVAEQRAKESEVLVVATPKKIVDSYLVLFDLLGLEPVLMETTISASTRLVMHAEDTDLPTLIVDFGSVSTDLSISDTVLRITGTVNEGGDTVSKGIAKKLGVTPRQAQTIKTKYGLGASKRQKDISTAVTPMLDKMVTEMKKMVRFYQERSETEKKLEQVIILGGGANMPGLADYLTDKIRIPTRVCNPWINLEFGKIQPPHLLEKTLYATASGLSLANPKEAIND